MKSLAIPLLALVAMPLVAAAQVPMNPCDGSSDHTAHIQAMLDTQAVVTLNAGQNYCVNAAIGLNVPSGSIFRLNGATVAMNPGCAQAGFVCRLIQTRTNTSAITVEGPGRLIGDPSPGCQSCWSIVLRLDSTTDFTVRRLEMYSGRSDLMWIGGNTKSSGIIDQVLGVGAGRNVVSAVNARRVLVVRSDFRDAHGVDPAALFDGEPNPGDSLEEIAILWSNFENGQLGIVNQKGQGNQGSGFIAAWNTVGGIRRNPAAPLSRAPIGLSVNGVVGVVLFKNTISVPAWSGTGSVPLAGTVAGNSVTLAASDVFLLHNTINGEVNDRGTPNPADDVFSGDFRFANVNNSTTIGNRIIKGKFTSALAGVFGDDVKLRNVSVP